MRRSFRDAIVGISILGGIIAFGGSMLWLRGIKVGANTWTVKANFSDASGLAEGSPVTYRGILIGSIGSIEIKPDNIQASLKIDKKNLLLPKPIVARLVKNSLLGSDIQVALISTGKIEKNSPLPIDPECNSKKIICEGDSIEGEALTSISSLTTELDRIVKKAGEEDIIQKLVSSAEQFDRTQKELENLILQAKEEIYRIQPIIVELTEASGHINNILAAIDNPKTLNDIKETANNARSLSKKIDIFGAEINSIMDDEELMDALRNVTIGLGQFFNEIYPSKTIR